jgi:DNA-binding CsgD family transcriptional regulator
MENEKNISELLSKRELEVFKLVSIGKTTKEISRIMNVKNNTVSTYKKNIELKTGAKNEIEIYKIALQTDIKLFDEQYVQPIAINHFESKFY